MATGLSGNDLSVLNQIFIGTPAPLPEPVLADEISKRMDGDILEKVCILATFAGWVSVPTGPCSFEGSRVRNACHRCGRGWRS
jgi:hypothetical protein